ncbi:MAG TPA: mechanosensitive ion channel domain-containing protein [Polyangiaceae bacterium]|nr:mechanosensitive ion channel domain-containing protein [Polyangiaceae bacterium]
MKRHWSIKYSLLLLFILLASLTRSAAAEESTEPGRPKEPAHPSALVEAPVVVFNRTITVLRAPLLGVPPADRARHTEARLSDLFSRPGPMKISVTSTPMANAILVNGALGLALTAGDADVLDGQTLEEATHAARAAIERVAEETREASDRERLWHALWHGGIATLLLIAVFVVVLRTRTWVVKHLTRLLEGSTQRLTAAVPALYGARLFAISRLLVRAGSTFLLLVACYRWASYVMYQFPYTRAWGEQLDSYLLGVLLSIGGGILHSLPDLLVALLIFVLARALLSVVDPVFDGIEKRNVHGGWLDADTAKPTRRIFAMAVWAFAAVMAYPYLPGASSEAFKGVSVLLGLMVTLGGSSLFGQAASGFILLYSRTLRIGEFVRVGDDEGTVTELGVFTTKIATGLGEQLSIPNALVLGTVTRNYSRPTKGSGFMLRTTVTIGYDSPWRQIQALLIEAARRTPGVSAEPGPQVFQTALSDFYIEYQLVCLATQTSAKSRAEALAALNANVVDTFNEYGVQIMSPHYLADPATAKVVPRSAWHSPPATPEKSVDDEQPAPAERA